MSNTVKIIIVAFIAGSLFGSGLVIGGMTSPHYIQGFLNFGGIVDSTRLGPWLPRLAFIMISAVSIMFIVFKLIHPKKQSKPIYTEQFNLPTSTKLSKRLIIGSVIFGIGWGLGGYCPGPGIAVILTKNGDMIIFVICMLLGMFCAQKLANKFTS